jgi:hypothetical protein
MCGACGAYSVKDWSWPWLADSRSVTLIARAAERLSRVRGIRILPASQGWQVLMPTGSSHLIQSVTDLARVAQIDSAATPGVSLLDSAETSTIDRRRSIMARVAPPGELPSAASRTWPDALLSPDTTVVTVDGASPIRLLRALEDLAQAASLAPYRDHIRLLPIPPEVAQSVVVHRWADLPEAIGAADLPALCLSLAARIVSLPQTDSRFREARIRCGESGLVQIQSIGQSVFAFQVSRSTLQY